MNRLNRLWRVLIHDPLPWKAVHDWRGWRWIAVLLPLAALLLVMALSQTMRLAVFLIIVACWLLVYCMTLLGRR